MKSLLLVMTACIVLGTTGCKNQLSKADINGTYWECITGNGFRKATTLTMIFRKDGRYCYIEGEHVRMGTWAIGNSQEQTVIVKMDDDSDSLALGFDKDRKHLYMYDFVKIGNKP